MLFRRSEQFLIFIVVHFYGATSFFIRYSFSMKQLATFHSFSAIKIARSKAVSKVFDHLIPETSGVAALVDNKPENVTKRHIVKHVTCDDTSTYSS